LDGSVDGLTRLLIPFVLRIERGRGGGGGGRDEGGGGGRGKTVGGNRCLGRTIFFGMVRFDFSFFFCFFSLLQIFKKGIVSLMSFTIQIQKEKL